MNTLKSLYNIKPMTTIVGKWHKNRYTIIKELGRGANGIVYLARFQQQEVAIKFSDNGMSITSEVNVLKSFAKVQGSSLGPCLIDVDDWLVDGKVFSFYVMEYIRGDDFLTFIRKKGDSWIAVLISQLLKDLQSLHDGGWVFGDLKPENLIVAESPPRIRCIDVGGTTIIGRAIKEYTEFYDRGYWGLGTRKAEPRYDLFAVSMIIINSEYPHRFPKKTGGINELQEKIKQKTVLLKFEQLILKALTGEFTSATEMREFLLKTIHSSHEKRKASATNNYYRTNSSRTAPVTKRKNGKRRLETFIITSIISFLYMWYMVEFLL